MKTIRVKIAVAVDPSGKWNASGWCNDALEAADKEAMEICVDGVGDGERRYWVEAELEVPESEIVQSVDVYRHK